MSDPIPERFQKLQDESDIRGVVTRYTYAVDWMRWDVLEELFWPDAAIDFGFFKSDRAGYMAWVKETEEQLSRRLHMFSGERIAISGDDAQAEVGCVIHTRRVEGEKTTDSLMWGRYLFELQRRDGGWRFTRLTYLSNFVQDFEGRTADQQRSRADNIGPDHRFAPRF